jgi:hypothetical protein
MHQHSAAAIRKEMLQGRANKKQKTRFLTHLSCGSLYHALALFHKPTGEVPMTRRVRGCRASTEQQHLL